MQYEYAKAERICGVTRQYGPCIEDELDTLAYLPRASWMPSGSRELNDCDYRCVRIAPHQPSSVSRAVGPTLMAAN